MTVQRKILVAMEAVFPAGAFLVGPVEPVWNFDKAVQRPDGSRPQQLDKETGLPIWQAPVLDMDPDAGNRDKTVVVKLVCAHQPVPPANKTNL
ncbi:MAG: plasmid replication, integration and excision activator, partial [Cutibacterium avidum]|nr:plasmid replication, integration and excision activator [Cutibacterium avidum]